MVENSYDSTSIAPVMKQEECAKWTLLKNVYPLIDVWVDASPTPYGIGFTYHFQAYSSAKSHLDRMYVIESSWCPPGVQILVNYACHLSDHFPVITTFAEYNWKEQMVACTHKNM